MDSSEKWLLVVMFSSDSPVKRCEGGRALLSQLLLLFLVQYVKSFRNLDDLLFRSLRASLVKFLIKN